MSLLAASAAAYNKELSLISHLVLHLGFDPDYAFIIWLRYIHLKPTKK